MIGRHGILLLARTFYIPMRNENRFTKLIQKFDCEKRTKDQQKKNTKAYLIKFYTI